ncbi:MAG: hypothetical protein DGJ47_000501 [Rickettsiaceae bacterium]
MCRFAAYFGHEKILLDELLSKPKNSLVKQSHKSIEGIHGINADGFGVAWYNFDISSSPGIFKSTQPAWNDNNLMHLSQKIKSSCFLAHVRASTVGDVNQNNCHPFDFQKYSMVHNGTIRHFERYKRKVIDELDNELFLNIKGNTDSEYFFFLIMNFIKQGSTLENSVKKAIDWIVNVQEQCDGFSRINIVITNGDELIATRFVSKGKKSLSLKYLPKIDTSNKVSSLVISSESLSDDGTIWDELPENHYLHINKNSMKPRVEKI